MELQRIACGRVTVVMIDGVAHFLARSFSKYRLTVLPLGLVGERYLCRCCCSEEVAADFNSAVLAAKEAGATQIIVRTPGAREIAGLPVEDVQYCVLDWGGVRTHC